MRFEYRAKGNREELYFCYGGWDRDLPPGIRYGPVIRDTFLIECCTGGAGSVIINGTEFPVKAGDCYFLLPGDTVTHTADLECPRSGVFCSFAGSQAGRYLQDAGIDSDHPYAPPECFPELNRLVEGLVTMIGQEDAGAPLRQRAYLNGIFGVLLQYTGADPERSPMIQKAIAFMEAHHQEPLTVDQIASRVGLERCYFSTKFKEETGLSPHQFLNRLRIRKACILLEHRHCSVSDCAEAVGLPPENFARIFRRWMGMSPRAFWDSIRGGSGKKDGSS